MRTSTARTRAPETLELVIVNTVYQLMIAVNMRLHDVIPARAGILLSDHTPSLIDRVEGLEASGLFAKVWYGETLPFDRYFWALPEPQKDRAARKPRAALEAVKYSEPVPFASLRRIYCANLNSYVKFVRMAHPDIEISLFEDGAAVCASDYRERQRTWDRLPGFNDPYYSFPTMHLFTPELMVIDPWFDMKQMPTLDRENTDIVPVLNAIFGYGPTTERFAPFVFVEQSYQADRIKNNWLDFLLATHRHTGYGPLDVKRHPRNAVDRAFALGLAPKSADTSVPFELLLLNRDTSGTVFITVSSGSLVSPWVMLGLTPTTVFLYRAINGPINSPAINATFTSYMDRFTEEYAHPNLWTPYSLHEFEDLLHTFQEANCRLERSNV